MTHIEAKLGAMLLLAFLLALFAMAASPPTEILNTVSGGCPPPQPVVLDA
jgi:hypothetical protein